MKKQHEIRFSSKRPLQLQNQTASMTQTRTNAFYDQSAAQKSNNSKALGQTLSISSSNNGGANGPPQPKAPHHLQKPVHQKQFM